MRSLRFLCLIGVVLAALILAGCGGGGGGGAAITGGAGITTTIGASTDPTSTKSGTRDDAISAPLDAGAIIEAFDFTTKVKLATGTIGADGKGSISLPPGKTVLVTVTGKRGGKDYRLSLIIPTTTGADTEYVAGPSTTVAAEALGNEYYGENKQIDQESWDVVVAAADTYFAANPAADVNVGGDLIPAGKAFGDEGSIAVVLDDVKHAVPQVLGELAMAKNAIQQIRDAGAPIKNLLDEEVPDARMVAESTFEGIGNVNMDAVISKYRILGDRLSFLILPAMAGDFAYEPAEGSPQFGVGIMDLEVGKAYRVAQFLQGEDLWLEDYAAGNTAGVVTIIRADGNDTHTLTARLSGNTWTISERSSADARLNYTATFPADIPEVENPTISASISLSDQFITTPLTLNGTAQAIDAVGEALAQIVITGSIGSAEFAGSAKTTLTLDEPRSGFDGWDGPIPTAIKVENLTGTLRANGLVATISGGLDAKLEMAEIGQDWLPLPTEMTLTNGAIAATANGKSFSLSGSGVLKMPEMNRSGVDYTDFMPTEFSATNVSLNINNQVTVAGKLVIKGELIENDGDTIVAPTEFQLQGEYHNNHSGTHLTGGNIHATWDNPGNDPAPNNTECTLVITGVLNTATHGVFEADLEFTTDGQGRAFLTITKLGWATQNLHGTGSGDITADGEIEDASLTLINQDGVTITLSQDLSGTVSVNDQTLGTIAEDEYGIKVSFAADDSFRYLIGNAPASD